VRKCAYSGVPPPSDRRRLSPDPYGRTAAEATPPGGTIRVDVAPGAGCLHVAIDNEGEVPCV
jgi:hypothetical protein